MARIRVRSSRPLIPGICTSATTHRDWLRWFDCRNSSADTKVWTRYPCELRRLSVAARTDASSSTIEITEGIDKAGLSKWGRDKSHLAPPAPESELPNGIPKPY